MTVKHENGSEYTVIVEADSSYVTYVVTMQSDAMPFHYDTMTKDEFIEKAIEGGHAQLKLRYPNGRFEINDGEDIINMYEALLDPKAWEAVGKIQGWRQKMWGQDMDFSYENMRGMIDHLKLI